MLSLFPQLLDWGWYVPFVFRLFLGIYFFFTGYQLTKMGPQKTGEEILAWTTLGVLIIILGVAFLLGVYVQIAGVVGFALSLIAVFFKYKRAVFTPEPIKYYMLIGVVALSLLFLGAGPHAFDLPL